MEVSRDFCPSFWYPLLQLGWSVAPNGCYTLDRVAVSAAPPLWAESVAKTRVLTIFDAFSIAGFGLAPASWAWTDSSWRALSIGGSFVQIGGVFSFHWLTFRIGVDLSL